MPYRRRGTVVQKLVNGRWVTVKRHPSAERAQRHLVALRINVEARER